MSNQISSLVLGKHQTLSPNLDSKMPSPLLHIDSKGRAVLATDTDFGENEQPCRRPISTVPVCCMGATAARTSEATPLLAPSVPCITEDVGVVSHGETMNPWAIFWEEVKTLLRYSLPVFG